MKPLSIMAAVLSVICIVAFYAGEANALATDNWSEVTKCMAAYKKANCKDLTGEARAVCNHTAWCNCFPEGCGGASDGEVCLDRALREDPGTTVAGGVALPNDHFIATLGIDENANWLTHLKVMGNFRGKPAIDPIICDFVPFMANIGKLIIREDPEKLGCPIMEDVEGVLDVAYLDVDGITEYDPVEDEEILYTDAIPEIGQLAFEDQAIDCVERLTTLSLVLNSNPCPEGMVCGCTEETVMSYEDLCTTYNSLGYLITVPCDEENCFLGIWQYCTPTQDPYCQPGPDSCDRWLAGCCRERTDTPVYTQVCHDSEGVLIACSACDFTGLYDDDFDYGFDACDVTEDVIVDGVVTIHHADCPYEMAKLLTNDQKEWISTLSGQIPSMLAAKTRQLMNDGYVVDDSIEHAAWLFNDVMNCLFEEGQDEYNEE